MSICKEEIYVNARFLTQPITGVQRFAIEISKQLKSLGFPVKFVAPGNILHKDLARELDVEILRPFTGHLWEQVTLQGYVLSRRKTLLSLCNTAPVFVKKQLVTVHDLCFVNYPQWFSKGFSLYYNFVIPRIVGRACHVLTVSQTSRQEIMKTYKVRADKISVIYNAVSPVFYKNPDADKKLTEENYILSVSSHHPRKNFKRLIEAFEMLGKTGIRLYIIGRFNKHFSQAGYGVRNKNEQVVFLEDITDEELVAYYRNARLFVYPSLYEGFGIPIIEAISQQTPVCVSDIPVFREICGGQAIYFDPESVEDIKAKMEKGIHETIGKVTIDLDRFSWKKGAESIITILNKMERK